MSPWHALCSSLTAESVNLALTTYRVPPGGLGCSTCPRLRHRAHGEHLGAWVDSGWEKSRTAMGRWGERAMKDRIDVSLVWLAPGADSQEKLALLFPSQ